MATKLKKLSSLEARKQYLQTRYLQGLKPYQATDEIKRHLMKVAELDETMIKDPGLKAVQQKFHHQQIVKVSTEMLSRDQPDFYPYFSQKLQTAEEAVVACDDVLYGTF